MAVSKGKSAGAVVIARWNVHPGGGLVRVADKPAVVNAEGFSSISTQHKDGLGPTMEDCFLNSRKNFVPL